MGGKGSGRTKGNGEGIKRSEGKLSKELRDEFLGPKVDEVVEEVFEEDDEGPTLDQKDLRARRLGYPNNKNKVRGSLFLDDLMFEEWKSNPDSLFNRIHQDQFRETIGELAGDEIHFSEEECARASRYPCSDMDVVLRQRLWAKYYEILDGPGLARGQLARGYARGILSGHGILARLRCRFFCLFLSFPPRDYSDYMDYVEEKGVILSQKVMELDPFIRDKYSDDVVLDHKLVKLQLAIADNVTKRKRGLPKNTISHELTDKGAEQAKSLQANTKEFYKNLSSMSSKELGEYMSNLSDEEFIEVTDVKELGEGKGE